MKNLRQTSTQKTNRPLHIIGALLLFTSGATSADQNSSPADRGKVLLSDDLSHAAIGTDWQPVHGKWESFDSTLRGSELDKEKHGAAIRRAMSFKDALIEFDVKLDGAKLVTLSIDDDVDHIARITLSPTTFKAQKDDHDHTGPDKSVVFGERKVNLPPGAWHTVSIKIVGDAMRANLDGKFTISGSNKLIGTQKANIGFTVTGRSASFRNLRIFEAEPSPELATIQLVPTSALTIDPNQPLLDTFSQLAPNASSWVLAGLDEGVPPNVRQNLTYLREDLLDEYKQKPKASQEAYKAAHQLCSTMIAALDERDQTLVRAGFRAVQADANATLSGNHALNARRNYMMSWPQYAREQAQRSTLQTENDKKSQVMKEQPKVEWSTRTTALRRTLDDLYAKFREALRQSPPVK